MRWLSDQFIARDFDIKWLHRTIVASDAYQRSSTVTASNRLDERNFSRAIVRRLPAETTIDAILRATANDKSAATFLLKADGRKIGQHPKSYQARGIDYSLLVFGKPRRTTSCDCERQDQPTLLQSLFARNDTEMIGWIERPDGWLTSVARELGQSLTSNTAAATQLVKATSTESFASHDKTAALIDSAYLRIVSRRPNADEQKTALKYIQESPNTVEGLRDIVWALLNTPEFLTNH